MSKHKKSALESANKLAKDSSRVKQLASAKQSTRTTDEAFYDNESTPQKQDNKAATDQTFETADQNFQYQIRDEPREDETTAEKIIVHKLKKVRPSIAKYQLTLLKNNPRPVQEGYGEDGEAIDGYETDYSVDSSGNFRLDSNGRKIPRYVIDPETGLPMLDANGNPIKKRMKKVVSATQGDDKMKIIQRSNQADQKIVKKKIDKQVYISAHLDDLPKPLGEATDTTEFLMLSLQAGLNANPVQIQDLLTNHSQRLTRVCQQGYGHGNFEPIIRWYETLSNQFTFTQMMELFDKAYDEQSFMEIALVLRSIKAGLYSPDFDLCQIAVRFLTMTVKAVALRGDEYYNVFQNWFVKIPSTSTKPPQNDYVNCPLRATMIALEQHPSLCQDISELIYLFFQSPGRLRLPQMYIYLKEACQDDIFLCYDSLGQMLPALRTIDQESTLNLIKECHMVTDSVLEATLNPSNDYSVKLSCTSLLIEAWSLEPYVISPKRQLDNLTGKRIQIQAEIQGVKGPMLKDQILAIIRSAANEKDKVYRITVLGQAFSLMEDMMRNKNTDSPFVYKVLIQSVLSHYKNRQSDVIIGEFYLDNFVSLFKDEADIPIDRMVEPFIEILNDKVQKNQKLAGYISTAEFNFVTHIINHEKFSEKICLQLLDLLTFVYLNRPYLAQAASVPLLKLITQFKTNLQVVEITEFIIKMSLAKVLDTKQDEITAEIIATKKQNNTPGKSVMLKFNKAQKDAKLEADAQRKIERFNSVFIVEEVYDIYSQQIESSDRSAGETADTLVKEMKNTTQLSFDNYKKVYGVESNGLQHLLEVMGLSLPPKHSETLNSIVAVLQTEEDTIVQGNFSNRSRSVMNLEPKQQFEDIVDFKKHVKELETKAKERKEEQWETVKNPKNKIAMRAFEHLHQVKQQRIKKENDKRLIAMAAKTKHDKLLEQSKVDVAMRGLILEKEAVKRQQRVKAVMEGNGEDPYQQNMSAVQVFEQPSPAKVLEMNPGKTLMKNHSLLSQALIKPSGKISLPEKLVASKNDFVQLVSIDDIEERERVCIRLTVQKNQQVVKYLFDRYSQAAQNKINTHQRQSTSTARLVRLELLQDRTIKNDELRRMLKDHNIDVQMVSKHELASFINLINQTLLLSYDSECLDFAGFSQFLLQVAVFLIEKNRIVRPSGLFYPLMGECLEHLFLIFDKSAKTKGLRSLLTDQPDFKPSGKQDEAQVQKVEELQSIIDKSDTDNLPPLPAGYRIENQLDQKKTFQIPNKARHLLNSKQIIAIDIIDELINDTFGIHFFESVIETVEKPVVKAKIEKKTFLMTPSHSALSSHRSSRKSLHGSQRGLSHSSLHNSNSRPSKAFGAVNEAYELPQFKMYKQDSIIRMQKVKIQSDYLTADTSIPIKPSRYSSSPMKKPPTGPNSSNDLALVKAPKQMRRMREVEANLVALNLSKDLKVASYDWLLARPEKQDLIIYEVVETLEDMLQSIETGAKYKTSIRKKKEKIIKKIQIDFKAVRTKPNVAMPYADERKEKDAAKARDQTEAEHEAKERYLERGKMLRLNVEKNKETRIENQVVREQEADRAALSKRNKDKKRKEVEAKKRQDIDDFKGKRKEIRQQIAIVEKSTDAIIQDLLGSTYALNENEYVEALYKGNPNKLKEEREHLIQFQKRFDVKRVFLHFDRSLKANFLCVAKQEAFKNLPQNSLTLEGFVKSTIKAGLMPTTVSLEDTVITFKQVMRDRQNESRDRPYLKAKPSDNMLHFPEYKVALIRQIMQAAYFYSTQVGKEASPQGKRSARLPNKSKTGVPIVSIDEQEIRLNRMRGQGAALDKHRNMGGTGGILSRLVIDQALIEEWQIEEFLRFVCDNMENKIKIKPLNLKTKPREADQVKPLLQEKSRNQTLPRTLSESVLPPKTNLRLDQIDEQEEINVVQSPYKPPRSSSIEPPPRVTKDLSPVPKQGQESQEQEPDIDQEMEDYGNALYDE